MDVLLKQMEAHREQLQIGYENQGANIHAQEGAIQECDSCIELIKASLAKADEMSEAEVLSNV
jgi:hypothetical protein